MEYNKNFINENIVNISLMAGKLMADGKISVEDHAELTDHIVALANSFEESHKGVDYNAPVKEGEASPDYWEDIDVFAEKSLIEAYPVKEDEWDFATTALGKFCLAEVPFRLREIFDIDPDTLDSGLISELAEKLSDVCLDYEAMDECIGDYLNEHYYNTDREQSNEALTEEQALSDVRQYLEQQGGQYFADRRTTKAEVLADTELLTQLAGRHHCLVNMFDGNREESCMSACDDNPGINMDEVYLVSSGGVRKEFYRGTPAECEKFCQDNDWKFVDGNAFEWNLALKSDIGPIKPSLTEQILGAAAQTGKGSKADAPALVQMPGTQDPDWGKKQRDAGR